MKDALDDLSPLARRAELSDAEQPRLDLLLENSAEARLFHELGRRVDDEDPLAPVANAASEAVVDSVMRSLEQSKSPKRRPLARSPWLIAVAALLAASLAGAAIGVQRWLSPPAPAPSASIAPSSPRSSAAPAIAAPTASSPEVVAPAPSTEPVLPRGAASAPPLSAAELLSAAGRARRGGNSARAVELLQTLRSLHPGSPEASASEITLAELQLERGAAAAALGHYDAYLRRSPGGALAPEALWGRAQALNRLGRAGEAQKSLRELLQRFPSSPYASSARAKLGSSAP